MSSYQTFDKASDETLIKAAVSGEKGALSELIKRYQTPIFNLSRGMLWAREDAHDATQEILIKVMTNLASFRGDSAFKTWVYRIATNHLIRERQKAAKTSALSFDQYKTIINNAPDSPLKSEDYSVAPEVLAEETKRICLQGMLLCLSPEQRVVMVLGPVLGLTAPEAAEVMGVEPDNFRKQLSRTRADLSNFMENQCGLVNPKNPCRCPKKTRAMIDKGMVNPENLTFNPGHLKMARDEAGRYGMTDDRWMDLFAAIFEEVELDFSGVVSLLTDRATLDKKTH